MERKEPFVMAIHRGLVKCPSCGVSIGFRVDVIGKEDISCPQCKYVFSYDDGFIENITHLVESEGPSILFLFTRDLTKSRRTEFKNE